MKGIPTQNLLPARDPCKTKWANTHNTLTSVHAKIQIKVGIRVAKGQTKCGITNWHSIRMRWQTVQARSVSEWAQQLETVKKPHIKCLQQHEDQPSAGDHLLNLWEARIGLARQWKKHKTNRRLKTRIDRINKKKTQEYSGQLSREQWHETCEKLNGTLNLTRTWNLVRALLEPNQSRTMNKHKILQPMQYKDNHAQLLSYLQSAYLPARQQPADKEYEGPTNNDIDEPFTLHEPRRAIHRISGNKKTGPDRLTTAQNKNLSEADQEFLLETTNEACVLGTVPTEWEGANVTFIPKPGQDIAI